MWYVLLEWGCLFLFGSEAFKRPPNKQNNNDIRNKWIAC
jgi:hypothetical protein